MSLLPASIKRIGSKTSEKRWRHHFPHYKSMGLSVNMDLVGWLCWGLTSQSTIFQSYRDGAIASWVINQYFRGVKCLAQGHNTAAVGLEPRTSRSGVQHSTTEPPRSPVNMEIRVLIESDSKPYAALYHANDVTHKIWSRLANWLQRYSSSKVWNFRHSRTSNSKMSGLIRPKIELDRVFMPVLVTSNFDDDSIKNEQASMETLFPHYKSMGNFLDAQQQLTP